MEEQKNIKWVLIISIIMFFALFSFGLPYSYPGSQRSIWDTIWYSINRIGVLLFIVTITAGALFTTGFGKKEKMYKLTLRLFMISMAFVFITFVRFLLPYP